MIELNGEKFYDAEDLCSILSLSYPRVCQILKAYNVRKIKHKYFVTEAEAQFLRNRKNQKLKFYQIKELL